MRTLVIILLAIFISGCSSASKKGSGDDIVEMTSIVGTLIDAKLQEVHFWPDGMNYHTTSWSNEIDIEINSPSEYAGLRLRFSMPEKGPITYANLKGKKVRLTLPKICLPNLIVQLPYDAAFLDEEPNQ